MLRELFFRSMIRLGFNVQKGPWAMLRNLNYSIRYPSDWVWEAGENSLVIKPAAGFGEVTISVRDNVWLSTVGTRMSILLMYQPPYDEHKLHMKRYTNYVEYNYSAFEQEQHWHTRAFRIHDRMYMITIKCGRYQWEEHGKLFMECLDSFKFKH